MRYRVIHRTEYHYLEQVAISHNVLHLIPRATPHQVILSARLTLEPEAAVRHDGIDWYGNHVVHATVQEPHRKLIIRSESEVEVAGPGSRDLTLSAPWEQVAEALTQRQPEGILREVAEFRFSSPRVPITLAYADLARTCFTPGRPIALAFADLCARIKADFIYDASATDMDTPVDEVLKNKRGVCQDFAHLALAALRSLGLAARYVSGYLETDPPPGQARLVGSDASHAWVQIHEPTLGWIDGDPTNGILTADRHIVVAWGRDIDDVTPTKGVILGGGHHEVQVSVDVQPLVDEVNPVADPVDPQT